MYLKMQLFVTHVLESFFPPILSLFTVEDEEGMRRPRCSCGGRLDEDGDCDAAVCPYHPPRRHVEITVPVAAPQPNSRATILAYFKRELLYVVLLAVVLYAMDTTNRRQPSLDETHGSVYTPQRKRALRERVANLIRHGYYSYKKHAFPADELLPLSCKGKDTYGGYSLTLIDSLDTLALIGEHDEFMAGVQYVLANISFAHDRTVSLFETTIRILGGLLSAHYLAERLAAQEARRALLETRAVRANYNYHGELVVVVERLAQRFVGCFDTPTGIPYNEVNLGKGVNRAESAWTCPAAAGTLLLEFGAISALTGNCTYYVLAQRALLAVWKYRSGFDLVGGQIYVATGVWKDIEATIGPSIDSFYEYMLKGHVLFGDDLLLDVWRSARLAVDANLRSNGWYLSASVHEFGVSKNVEHRVHALQAFWPGLLVLDGDLEAALESYEKLYCVVRKHGFFPEYVHLAAFFRGDTSAGTSGPGYPLRPEFVESTFYLYEATKSTRFLMIAEDFLNALEGTKQKCGFAALQNIFVRKFEDKMDSFILAETLKYLYLIFSDEERGSLPYHLLDLAWVGTTEAHPIPVTAATQALPRKCAAMSKLFLLANNNRSIADESFFDVHRKKAAMSRGATTACQTVVQDLPPQCPRTDFMRVVSPFLQRVSSSSERMWETCRDTSGMPPLVPIQKLKLSG